MFNAKGLQSLSGLPAPLLTAYLKTSPDDASLHPPVRSCLAWLRQEADSLSKKLPRNESDDFHRQLRRLEEFLHDRIPRERGLVVFAGPGAWETVALQVEVVNELHWGKPAVTQLQWLAARHKPYCIVLVDRSGATIFGYQLGEFSELQEMKFDVDTSQWKKKDRAHVARPGVRETYGAQRDVFDHRVEAQYRRLSREVADETIRLCRKEGYSAVCLAGPERLAAPIAGRFPAELFARVIWIHKDLSRVDPIRMQEHIEPEIEKWELAEEMTLVNDLLDEERGAVLGIDGTLAQLQRGRVGTLAICRDLDARVFRCEGCGYTDYSADPACGLCRGSRKAVPLRAVLPELAAAADTQIEVVSGEAAAKLKQAGGIGAWLRQPRQSQSRRKRVLAHV
jgi:hypothetical protein